MSMQQWQYMVWQILALREAGYTYRQIDAALELGRRSYRIMNGRRAKALLAMAR